MCHHIQPCTCECSLHPCVYYSEWESINHFATLGGDYFIIFSRIQYSSSDLLVFQLGSHLSDCQKVGYMGIDPVCPSHSLLSHSQCSLLWGFPGSWGLSWTNPGLQGLSDLHHSPGLHLLEPIWWCSQWVEWGCFPGLHRQLIYLWGLRGLMWMNPGIMGLSVDHCPREPCSSPCWLLLWLCSQSCTIS